MEGGFRRNEYEGVELIEDGHIGVDRLVLLDTLSIRRCFPGIRKQAWWKRVLLWFAPWREGWVEGERFKRLFGRTYFEGMRRNR